ncbi:MAG: YjiG family protein [Synergistaceae bacterium]|nr:YjiG family protein [Synergistaceae bacterium]
MAEKRLGILDMFVAGARRGFNISMTGMLPNVVMAFVVIRFLNLSGLLTLISKFAAPLMAVFGLPGEAVVVLVTAFMSTGGGCGSAAALATSGAITYVHATQLLPCIILMGSMIQYMGRCLGTADALRKYWWLHCVISVMNGLLALWVMKILILFTG